MKLTWWHRGATDQCAHIHHKVTALTIQVAGVEEGAAASTEAYQLVDVARTRPANGTARWHEWAHSHAELEHSVQQLDCLLLAQAVGPVKAGCQ